ncbi:hypothetical protein V495_06968 [Pseudogymnoascus sp. VKM F-4514 (FW-929)]|nr:hypothetical protein V495_06968 [Pseudogymnoascus sp. VKM F-4514 (FW-929)]KFY58243.1 hypothetical protein V497_04960 [Pseudogymnoascus sp. VKM F-4516 (FW-969)]
MHRAQHGPLQCASMQNICITQQALKVQPAIGPRDQRRYAYLTPTAKGKSAGTFDPTIIHAPTGMLVEDHEK